ncbi:alpha/beta-hydrolase, partial [Aulographum hederae CBS 113979]
LFPKAAEEDAPYSFGETRLQDPIYLPPTFMFGKREKTILLVPGTGNVGWQTYRFVANWIPYLQNTTWADVAWLNLPNYLLNDIQENAEMVAYAINYVSAISGGKKISVMSWSQGGIDTQWALKYWPSARSKVEDFVAFAPDFHGTTMTDLSCKLLSDGCAPAVLQQGYTSALITTLRASDGSTAYVPTTTLYSAQDEIVQPQSGTNASAYLPSSALAPASNNQIQTLCPNQPASAGWVTHEGVLYNGLAAALAIDALRNEGPGSVERLGQGGLEEACGRWVWPGFDWVGTEGALLQGAAAIFGASVKVTVEPPIMGYAS